MKGHIISIGDKCNNEEEECFTFENTKAFDFSELEENTALCGAQTNFFKTVDFESL